MPVISNCGCAVPLHLATIFDFTQSSSPHTCSTANVSWIPFRDVGKHGWGQRIRAYDVVMHIALANMAENCMIRAILRDGEQGGARIVAQWLYASSFLQNNLCTWREQCCGRRSVISGFCIRAPYINSCFGEKERVKSVTLIHANIYITLFYLTYWEFRSAGISGSIYLTWIWTEPRWWIVFACWVFCRSGTLNM